MDHLNSSSTPTTSKYKQRDIPARRTSLPAAGRAGATVDPLVIGDIASLRSWEQGLRLIRSNHDLPEVLFHLPEFSDLQNQSLSALARGYQKECGCTSGSLFMSVTVVALVAAYFGSGGHISGIHLMHVVNFLVVTFLAALAGKLIGLLWARWRLLKMAHNIYARLVEVS